MYSDITLNRRSLLLTDGKKIHVTMKFMYILYFMRKKKVRDVFSLLQEQSIAEYQ